MGLFDKRTTTSFCVLPLCRKRRAARCPELETMESRALLSGMPMHAHSPLIVHAEVAKNEGHPLNVINLHNQTIQGEVSANVPTPVKDALGKTTGFTYRVYLSNGSISNFPGMLTGTLLFEGKGTAHVQNVTELVSGSLNYFEPMATHAQTVRFDFSKEKRAANIPFATKLFPFTFQDKHGRFNVQKLDPAGTKQAPGHIRFQTLLPALPAAALLPIPNFPPQMFLFDIS